MVAINQKLARKQELFIAALLAAPSIAEAARAVKIGENTALRWLQVPEVQAQYRALRRQVVEQALATLQSATSEAVEALRRNLTAESGSVQVRAATAILEHAVKAVELVDIVERLEALEAQLAARHPAAAVRAIRGRGGGA